MSQTFVTEFGESPLPNPQHDLLARLYREIGLSAVAAALEVINEPAAPATLAETPESGAVPMFPHEENLAA